MADNKCIKASNSDKCKRYRMRIGKPRGPGKPGNKSGKNYTPRGRK